MLLPRQTYSLKTAELGRNMQQTFKWRYSTIWPPLSVHLTILIWYTANVLGWNECLSCDWLTDCLTDVGDSWAFSAVKGSSLSGIVRGGTGILDTVQCLGVRNVSGCRRLQDGGKQGESNRKGGDGVTNTELKSCRLQIRPQHIPRCFGAQNVIHPHTHSAVCLTTDPQPLTKPVLQTMRSSASAFSFQYPPPPL